MQNLRHILCSVLGRLDYHLSEPDRCTHKQTLDTMRELSDMILAALGSPTVTPVQYVYSFVAWPDETWDFDRAVYDYFRVFRRRVEMHFTEEEFERFRSGLGHHGLTLREVTRRPHIEAEPVS